METKIVVFCYVSGAASPKTRHPHIVKREAFSVTEKHVEFKKGVFTPRMTGSRLRIFDDWCDAYVHIREIEKDAMLRSILAAVKRFGVIEEMEEDKCTRCGGTGKRQHSPLHGSGYEYDCDCAIAQAEANSW